VAERLPATLRSVSDSPPKDPTGPGPEEAAKPPVPATENAAVKTEVPATGALADAAKAMDAAVAQMDAAVAQMNAAVAKSDVPLPTEAAVAKDSATAQPAAPEIPKDVAKAVPEEIVDDIAKEVAKSEAPKPAVDVFQLPATTSGMHQQYIAPGVARQSMLSSMKYQIALAGMVVALTLLMLQPGGISLGLGSDTTTTSTPPATTHVNDDLTNSFPNPNINQPPPYIPQADLTVNAGAIGGATSTPLSVPLVKKGDAGANKGGYAEESADLNAAEAMINKDPVKALQMVDQHDLDYPRGILDPEARVIRVEAYAKKGDDVKALQLGDDFLMDYPHSPRAGRVVAIVEALRNKLDSGRQP
jgi:hypothetical protein